MEGPQIRTGFRVNHNVNIVTYITLRVHIENLYTAYLYNFTA